ncbi:MAG: L,D-transpeptidase [Sphingomonadales bacterium CG12_big_fil_rev_8_21_14_0_65_65_10]|uniref:L,D-transpeptidase family protein n=1 Tax=Blastomonas marina TaxID=1867408 RepID=UPI000CC57ED4|nr:L,D-transpeptidase family protein [Blastomonas marina]PIW54970.1 MAG: L,D-transpeptidase [Sphingomonadales bacterium CG12_big_fil_rev_8_21_14_0_65_65_10]WPZ03170.1 L,D-transpeptidase family protein [Blastomonas marina]
MNTRTILSLGAATLLVTPLAAGAQEAGAETEISTDSMAVDRVTVEQEVSQAVVQDIPPEADPDPVGEWSVKHAEALLAAVENIGTEGLIPADYEPEALRAAIDAGEGEALDTLASRIFVYLVEDLRDGRTPMDARRQWFVVDPDADRLPTFTVMEQALASGDIAGALVGLAPEHRDYAALKAELAKTTETKKRKLIMANMDRWRWLPRELGRFYLLTNVPEYKLRVTVGDKVLFNYRTIVGKPGRTATPQLAETVEGVVFNPTWTVPQSIVKGEGLGAKVLNNPAWARANGYVATRGENGWVTVVQQPGPGNSLGRMKLDMPNPHAIFIHDTPAKSLFAQDYRALSHGCIRTEHADELAITMAIVGKGATRDEAVEIAASGKYTKVPLERKWPVYITYFTMGTDVDGKMKTFGDIYDRDAPVLASFDAERVGNRARVTSEKAVAIEAPGA